MLKTILLTNQIQNRQYLKDLQRLIAKFDKNDVGPRKNKKVDLNCSNRYETLSVTVINPESEREDSVDVTITDTSTDNNTRPDYTRRIYQQNNNLKKVYKTKTKITENVNRGNDIRVGNVKQRP